jgi:hypothetical protein
LAESAEPRGGFRKNSTASRVQFSGKYLVPSGTVLLRISSDGRWEMKKAQSCRATPSSESQGAAAFEPSVIWGRDFSVLRAVFSFRARTRPVSS